MRAFLLLFAVVLGVLLAGVDGRKVVKAHSKSEGKTNNPFSNFQPVPKRQADKTASASQSVKSAVKVSYAEDFSKVAAEQVSAQGAQTSAKLGFLSNGFVGTTYFDSSDSSCGGAVYSMSMQRLGKCYQGYGEDWPSNSNALMIASNDKTDAFNVYMVTSGYYDKACGYSWDDGYYSIYNIDNCVSSINDYVTYFTSHLPDPIDMPPAAGIVTKRYQTFDGCVKGLNTEVIAFQYESSDYCYSYGDDYSFSYQCVDGAAATVYYNTGDCSGSSTGMSLEGKGCIGERSSPYVMECYEGYSNERRLRGSK